MESVSYFRFLFAMTGVLLLIFGASWALRRYVPGLIATRPRGGIRRLALVEALPLDPKRRLVLVRRDDHEHLLLLGSDGDLVIETDCAAPRFQLPQPESGS